MLNNVFKDRGGTMRNTMVKVKRERKRERGVE